jgi:hypothetical protein
MLTGIAERTGTSMKELNAAAKEFVGFFKHADRDPGSTLDKFTEKDADVVLVVACIDFGRVAKGKPVELQVYEAWWFAQAFEKVTKAPLSVQPVVRRCIRLFPPGIRRAPRAERLRLGLEELKKARLDPSLRMEIQREVILPSV